MMTEARVHEVDPDPSALAQLAVEKGWADGLPIIPSTPERVARFIEASGESGSTVIARIPPLNGECTVELLAINAVMAGAPANAMPLLVASIAAMAEPDFELHSINATTASVVPAVIVNGQVRHETNISYGAGCVGGADGNGPSVGRAIRLTMRNVGAQRAGVTSQSVFGQPGRVSGIVFAEWEERSPWRPLAERRGTSGSAVTVFGAMGTMNIVDTTADSADQLLQLIGRSVAYPGANGYLPGFVFSEVVIGINPVWAEIIGEAYPDIETVESLIWDAAAIPIDHWPSIYHPVLEKAGRIADDGRVHLMKEREGRVLVAVCGGLGGLHALGINGFGTSTSITRPVHEVPRE